MFRILVVDDDQETCRFMKELLARPDREIELAYDPDRALAIVGEMPFDLVISDINLNSRLTGLDVLRAFKSASPDAQVLLISGFGSLEMAVDAVLGQSILDRLNTRRTFHAGFAHFVQLACKQRA